MISALQHYVYCPRQCALIHIDSVFDENIFTQRGRRLHETADLPGASLEHGVRVERALPIWSERLGVTGKADVVEFRDDTPYPVEYKHGPARKHFHDDVQLTAQALCLEEILNVAVPKGALYHYSSRKRREVVFTPQLRADTEKVIEQTRQLLAEQILPPPVHDKRCDNCSLRAACLPETVRHKSNLVRELFIPAQLSENW